jgi:hypothetical protein
MSGEQQLTNFIVGADTWDICQRDLRAAGFEVRRQQRAGGTLMGVLIRTETGDEDEATKIIERHVPDVRRGPPSVPTRSVVGYREAR